MTLLVVRSEINIPHHIQRPRRGDPVRIS